MAFDWNAYLELAERLTTDNATKEAVAKNRSAVSRAYYAVYNLARAQVPPGVTRRRRGSSHRDLIDHFDQCGQHSIANLLESMRDRRNGADYDAEKHSTYPEQWRITAETATTEAKKVLRKIENQL